MQRFLFLKSLAGISGLAVIQPLDKKVYLNYTVKEINHSSDLQSVESYSMFSTPTYCAWS